MNPLPTVSQINNRILTVRGRKVILDTDLARLYGVPVKRLNEQLSRNLQKFPADFAFQLTVAERAALRSQLEAVSLQPSGNQEELSNWSQIATSFPTAGRPILGPQIAIIKAVFNLRLI